MRKILVLFFLSLCSYVAFAQDSTLNEYKGVYKFPEGSATSQVEISIQDGALFANSTIGSAAFSKVSKDTFSIPDHNGMAFFYRNTEGKVNKIKIEVADLLLEGDKDAAAIAITRRKQVYLFSK
jgi:hypothetical protein